MPLAGHGGRPSRPTSSASCGNSIDETSKAAEQAGRAAGRRPGRAGRGSRPPSATSRRRSSPRRPRSTPRRPRSTGSASRRSCSRCEIETTPDQAGVGRGRHQAQRAAPLQAARQRGSMMNLIGATDGSGALVEGKHYLERVSEKRRSDLARSTRLRKDARRARREELDAQKRRGRRRCAPKPRPTKTEIDVAVRAAAGARDGAARRRSRPRGVGAATYSARGGRARGRAGAGGRESRARSPRPAAPATTSADGRPGSFIRPVAGSITSGFGYRTDPITGASAFHAGIDFGASCGTPIKAAGNGVVGRRRAGRAATATRPSSTTAAAWRPSTATSRRSSVGRRPVRHAGPGDRLRGLHRQVDRVPPPLRGARQRQPGRPPRLPVTGDRSPATDGGGRARRADDGGRGVALRLSRGW